MNLIIESEKAVRSYVVSAAGFVAGITMDDFSSLLQILSFIISCAAGLWTIWLHQKQINRLKVKAKDENEDEENQNIKSK